MNSQMPTRMRAEAVALAPTVPLRPAATVMRLARLGAFHATRLSFMPALLRRLAADDWRCDRPVWRVDDRGVGHAVYRVRAGSRSYALVTFAHDLPDANRSDRVIATAWDATFALVDGMPDAQDIARLARNVPRQEAGRVSVRELVLSRANRSVRMFEHVADRLAAGCQPDAERIAEVGYLMRTTAVYGSGKFGAADRAAVAERPELSGPFRAEMLAVWLIRAFSLDLVEHMARVRGGAHAVRLEPALRRRFGVGNSTGLGMAPFLVNHPLLLHRWIAARETALARVRSRQGADDGTVAALSRALAEARANAEAWRTGDPVQRARLADLRGDLARIADRLAAHSPAGSRPWDRLWRWGEEMLSLEGQEALVSLLLAPHGALVDDLAEEMAADEEAGFRIDGAARLSALCETLARDYDWALDGRAETPEMLARFWYVSEEKLEPRLGERAEEPGAECELPLDIARRAAALARDGGAWTGPDRVADFLLAHPEHRLMVRRAQLTARYPYSEVRDCLTASGMRPVDLLRCKLSFFGATRFDPRSDRWVRICMYQDAPLPDEMGG